MGGWCSFLSPVQYAARRTREGQPLPVDQLTPPMTNPIPNPTLDDVRRALALADFDVEAAWQRMVPRPRAMRRPSGLKGEARRAGVLLLLYPLNGVLTFPLTRRTETVATHKGQISLPGGAQEEGETPVQTAFRETCEELSIGPTDQIDVLGALAPLYVSASDFEIHPIVGYLPCRPDFHPDPVEVAEVLEMSLPMLLDDVIKVRERWTIHGLELDVPFYRVAGQAVWGATAILLGELEGRLRAVMGRFS
jgi:8-oxo-dGTP pyrophosphatase MutT (NUDIX family)